MQTYLQTSYQPNKLGLPQSHISKIENSGTDPRLSTVTDMARLLDSELLIVPREKLQLVKALIDDVDLFPNRVGLWRMMNDE